MKPIDGDSLESYLAQTPEPHQQALLNLRKAILASLPEAEEVMHYGMPAFKVNGKVILWMAAMKNHCSFFPGSTLDQFRDELTGYKLGKGTIQFRPDKPIPEELVRKLCLARVADKS